MSVGSRTFIRIRDSTAVGSRSKTIENDSRVLKVNYEKDEKQGLINNQRLSWEFRVFRVFRDTSQENVFDNTALDLIPSGLEGYSGTVLCYGQTGAGKTYTMSGVSQRYPDRGIIPRSLQQLFELVEAQTSRKVSVKISYVEIYNEQLIDLLDPNVGARSVSSLTITDGDGDIYIKGLQSPRVERLEQALSVLFESEGLQLREATSINRSLSLLEQTVIALSDKTRDHVPYRHSKLTHYLKNCIGGQCRTVLIANIWAKDCFSEETISTLRFATRVMRIPCQPIAKEQYDISATIKQLQKENKVLRKELLMYDTLNNRGHIKYDQLTEQQKQDIRSHVVSYLDGDVTDLEVVNLVQLEEVFSNFRQMNQALKSQVEKLRQQMAKSASSSDTRSPIAAGGSQSSTTMATATGTTRTNQRGGAGKRGGAGQGVDAIDKTGQQSQLVGEVDPSSGYGFLSSEAANPNSVSLLQDSGYSQAKRKEYQVKNANLKGTPQMESSKPTPEDASKLILPPTKVDAFNDFKSEAGRELFNIFSDNKVALREKLQEAFTTANQVNLLKSQLEELHSYVNRMKEEREAQGLTHTTEGEPIVTEEEYELLCQIHSLKADYTLRFEEWRKLKDVVNYCKQMVNLSRARLIQEFDYWFAGCFVDQTHHLSAENEAAISGDVKNQVDMSKMNQVELTKSLEIAVDSNASGEDDALLQFESVQNKLFETSPQGRAYERAKESTIHRHIYGQLPKPKNTSGALPRGIAK